MAEISRLMGISRSSLVYVVDGLTPKISSGAAGIRTTAVASRCCLKKRANLFARFERTDSESGLVRCLERMPQVVLLNELVKGLKGSERYYLSRDSADVGSIFPDSQSVKAQETTL